MDSALYSLVVSLFTGLAEGLQPKLKITKRDLKLKEAATKRDRFGIAHSAASSALGVALPMAGAGSALIFSMIWDTTSG